MTVSTISASKQPTRRSTTTAAFASGDDVTQQPFLFEGATLPDAFHEAWDACAQGVSPVVKILTVVQRGERWTIHLAVNGKRVVALDRDDVKQAARDLYAAAHPMQ